MTILLFLLMVHIADAKRAQIIKFNMIHGWIIDCYGPFKANKNDASILDYILEKDEDLLRILEPEKTFFFLDRGFRDIYRKLEEVYNFKALIPTCKQLEQTINSDGNKDERQLTVEQTTKSRFVTKCRFIIEYVNGKLKRLKALDNIRNTQLNHIFLDYRNACAMINFFHKPCCPDGDKAVPVAKGMKREAMKDKNELDFLLKNRFGTKFVKEIRLSELNDFPKLPINVIMEKILFGTFQYKQCQSYYQDLGENDKGFIVHKKFLKNISKADENSENSKIIAFEIASRHKRSYICNCMSGKKVVGTCVHVAAVLCYLAHDKFNELKPQAKFLQNIFIETDENDLPNVPKRIRNNRRMVNKELNKSPTIEEKNEELEENNGTEENNPFLSNE
ncbi:disulfide-isomerase a6, partial [Brachionus plicatilis]